MPNCTIEEMPFAKLGRREIEARFDGGEVSSDGGLLLLRQVERRLGLLKQVAPVLPDPRSPLLVRHTTEQMLRQRVFGLCQGYEDLNDHDQLKNDLALQTALDKDRAGASSPTLCRFENRADRKAAIAIHRIRPVHRLVCPGAGGTDPRFRCYRRSRPWQPGWPAFQCLLRQLLLPAALRLLRRTVAGRLPTWPAPRSGRCAAGYSRSVRSSFEIPGASVSSWPAPSLNEKPSVSLPNALLLDKHDRVLSPAR